MNTKQRSGDPVVIVAGLRTPFAKQLSELRQMSAIDLGVMVVNELLARVDVDPREIDRIVFGQVVILPEAPNIAREVALNSVLPASTDAYSVSRACATSLQSVASISDAITSGEIDIGLAGGADSTSILPIQVTRRLADTLTAVSRERWLGQKLKRLTRLRLRDLKPVAPAIRDYTTLMSMGEIAEQMAKNHAIDRRAQDQFALRSHQRAQAAWESGYLDEQVMLSIPPPHDAVLKEDNVIRGDSTLERLSQLRPVFDRRYGTVTAGNSTPLTDGAGVLLLMRHSRAQVLGMKPIATIRGQAFAALDPFNDGLMGPSYAVPKVLERAGLQLADIDLIEMHEAFAAQVLANINNWPSVKFAREHLGRDQAIGEIDWDRFNVLGGSLAYGHPFAATGVRLLLQLAYELRRRGGGLGLATACAAGGLGAATVLEVA